MKMKTGIITFRPLRETDLPLIHKWLNAPHVSEWWSLDGNHRPSLEEVVKHFSPRTGGTEPVDCYMINCGGRPIGMIQSCKLDDFPAEKAMFGLEDGYAGIDLFIGEEDYVHKGLGSGIIGKYVKEIIFDKYGVSCCVIDPDPGNIAAIKAYDKAGFRHLKTVWNEKDKVDAYLMTISQDELMQAKGNF
jgi:RimJ/RimL family protein N-acetyltransferase